MYMCTFWNKCEIIFIFIDHFYLYYVKAVKYMVLYLCLLSDFEFFFASNQSLYCCDPPRSWLIWFFICNLVCNCLTKTSYNPFGKNTSITEVT